MLKMQQQKTKSVISYDGKNKLLFTRNAKLFLQNLIEHLKIH